MTRRADGSLIRNCDTADPAIFDNEDQPEQAKALCFACPARVDCLRQALCLPVNGVAGGLTRRERERLAAVTGARLEEPSPLVWASDRQIVADHIGTSQGIHSTMSPLIAEVIRARAVAGQVDGEISTAIGLSVRGVQRYRTRFGITAAQPLPTDLPERRLQILLAPHGTPSAYKRHRKMGEKTCAECRAGHAARERDRLARARERLAGMPSVRRAS